MKAYKVVTEKDLLAFSSQVSSLVKEGWELVGGVSITEDETEHKQVQQRADDETQARFIFSQSLCKSA